MTPPRLLAVMGPTASGKTALAEEIALRLGAQLINADAFQVYRGFDIGTGKPQNRERYELLDVCDPHEQFGVGAFVRLAGEIATRCFHEGQDVVVVGGTGLYIRALLEGYTELAPPPEPGLRAALQAEEARRPGSLARRLLDLEPETKVDLNNPVRVRRRLEVLAGPPEPTGTPLPPFRKRKIGIGLPTTILNEAIRHRIDAMLEQGWERETRSLLDSGVSWESPAFRAIGYRLLARVSCGQIAATEAKDQIVRDTMQYAKRQRTWLRSEPGLARIEIGSPFHGSGDSDVLDAIWDAIVRSDQL